MPSGPLCCATLVCILLTGCASWESPGRDNAPWLSGLIAEFQSEPVGNPPHAIYQYTYNGRIVYYVPPQCCDQFSTLYDADGIEICAPDGGFSGGGDGRCPDFFDQATDKVLIWEDPRR